MGLGKSVEIAGLLNYEPGIESVLILCPAIKVTGLASLSDGFRAAFNFVRYETRAVIFERTSSLSIMTCWAV